MTAARRARGFTLVELVMVVAIVMLAASAVVVNLDAVLPQARIESSARELSATLASARASSIAQGLPYRLEYDLDRGNPRFRVALPFQAGGGIATDDEQRVYTDWKPLPEGVRIDEVTIGTRVHRDGICRVVFQPNGNTIEHVVKIVRDTPPGTFHLVIQGLTGFVQFYGADWRPDPVAETDFR